MNTVLRIVWKDFLGLRGRLALWFGAMLLKSALGLWLLFGPLTGSGAERIVATMGVLAVLELALTFLLAGLLVQADPLVGEQAFWRTRPISGRRLLAGKMLGAALLLGLPVVLAALPWWLVCAARPVDMAAAAAVLLAIQVPVALPAMLVAAVTASAGRFLVAAIMMLFVVMTTLSTWLPAATAERNALRPFLMLGGWLVVGIAVIVAQYARIGFARALAGLGAGGLAVFAVAAWAPVPGWDATPVMTERNAVRAAGVTLRIADTKVTVPAHKRGPAGLVRTRLHVDGVPEGTEAGFYGTRHVWTWTDGTTSEVQGFPMFRAGTRSVSVRRLFGEEATSEPAMLDAPVHVDAELRERIEAGAAHYAVTAHVALLRPRLLGEIPGRGGARGAWSGRGLRLIGFAPADTPVAAAVPKAVTTEFPTSPGGMLTRMRASMLSYSPLNVPRYFFFGQDRRKAVPVSVRGGLELPLAGVVVGLPTFMDAQGRPADWGTAGTLAVLEWDEEAAVVRTATHAP
jgi:hypothetical protein